MTDTLLSPPSVRRILVADDDVVSRMLLEATLQDLGYDVQVATDGAEALQLLEASDGPQLAILDVDLLRGREALDGAELGDRVGAGHRQGPLAVAVAVRGAVAVAVAVIAHGRFPSPGGRAGGSGKFEGSHAVRASQP